VDGVAVPDEILAVQVAFGLLVQRVKLRLRPEPVDQYQKSVSATRP